MNIDGDGFLWSEIFPEHPQHRLKLTDPKNQGLVSKIDLSVGGHLELEDLSVNGAEDKVRGSNSVAPLFLQDGLIVSGHENDRGMASLLALAQDLGNLKAVHPGHFDIEQNHCIILSEGVFQRLLPICS